MNGIKRFFNKRTKTGASLLVVIISVTLLIVMGTTFSVIAMSAYNNSHRRLCQQQAYYTAEACLNILSTQFASDPTGKYMNDIRNKIKDKYEKGNEARPGTYAHVSDAVVTIANLEDKEGNDGVTKIPSNNFEASLIGIVGGCEITASAVEGTKSVDSISQIRLRSTGYYKGYSQTISARMATTTNGALELKKIFSNSQSWKTPIVTLIAGETTGDMYFSSPGQYERWDNGEIKMTKANKDLRDKVYGKVASGNTNVQGAVHTRPFGIDNKPLKLPSTRCVSNEYLLRIREDELADVYNDGKEYTYYASVSDGDVKAQAHKEADRQIPTITTNVQNKYQTGINNIYLSSDPTIHGDKLEYLNYYGINNDALDANLDDNGSIEKKIKIKYRQTKLGDWQYPEFSYMIPLSRPNTASDAFDSKNMWYNDWVEIYMFTGDSGPNKKNIVDGDMYVNTQALIGLYDKDQTQVKYWPYRDIVSHRDKVERKYVSYAGKNFDDEFAFYRDIYRNGYDMGANFEHGGTGDLFFDYNTTPPAYNQSVLSHNGNMYLFEDARIECYDSTHTPNATKGVKNNIFAHKNLVIDGVAMKQGKTETQTKGNNRDYSNAGIDNINYKINNLFTERNVSIYGDVMVEGDLMISNATIYGDVYVNGDNLYISDSEIYGNVYFNGTHMITDGAKIRGDEKTKKADGTINKDSKGNVDGFSFEADNGRCVKLNGGDLIVLGRRNGVQIPDSDPLSYSNAAELVDERAFAQQEIRYKKERVDRHMWGVRLTNTSVSGTLFSEINTVINTMFRSVDDYRDADGVLHEKQSTLAAHNNIDGNYIEDVYGNIVVSANLLFDLQEKYRHDQHFADQTYLATLINNAVRVKGICMAERMQLVQTQSGDKGKAFGKPAKNPEFKHNFTRYEVGYIKDINEQLDNGTKTWDGAKDPDEKNITLPTDNVELKKIYPYLPHFLVDRGIKEYETSNHYRCSNVNIHSLCVGAGGVYVDGTQQYYEHSSNLAAIEGYKKGYWYAQYQPEPKEHSGIIVDEIYCISEQKGTYKVEGTNKTTASKIAVYNVAGKPKKETGYIECEVYTPQPTTTYFRGEMGPSHINQLSASAILDHIYGEIYGVISGEIKNRIEKGGKDYPLSQTRGAEINTMDAIMDVLREYYMKEKAPHRINGYYAFMSNTMNYRGYKDLTDIRTWCNNDEGRGPYQKYDPNAKDGVWRQITVLDWKAPTTIAYHEFTDAERVSSMETPPTAGGRFNKNSINVTKLPEIEGVVRKDNGVTVISSSFSSEYPIYVPAGCKVIFDTSEHNLHCKIKGGIILGDNAEVVLRGGNMTFLYLNNETTNLNYSQPDSAGNLIMYLGTNAKFGAVEGSQSVERANDSIYCIGVDPVSYIRMEHAASINGYVYAPHGYLEVAEYNYKKSSADSGTGDGGTAGSGTVTTAGGATTGGTTTGGATTGGSTNVSAKDPIIGTVNTVVRGSMIVRSFLIDMNLGYDTIYGMYKNLKYEYIMAPLICDTNIEYGDNEQQVEDYGKINWGFIGYD